MKKLLVFILLWSIIKYGNGQLCPQSGTIIPFGGGTSGPLASSYSNTNIILNGNLTIIDAILFTDLTQKFGKIAFIK